MHTMVNSVGETSDKEEAEAKLKEVKAYLDRMVNKGIIHKNKAANDKSALEKAVNLLS